MFAMTESTNEDMLQKDNGFDIKPTSSFDVNVVMNMDDDQSMVVSGRNDT